MTESWMLQRLKRETSVHHLAADNDRLAILGSRLEVGRYAAFLSRIYGFEAPVESALAMTKGIDELVDLRARSHTRLLRADLGAMGIVDPSTLPRASGVVFRDAFEALGWMYVVQRNTLLHGIVERHVRSRLPDQLKVAGAYLSAQTKGLGARLRELGLALDHASRSVTGADRIVAAARAAFRIQHAWYDGVSASHQQVA